jgi:hypothetical protein
MYLLLGTRPDIVFAVSCLSCFMVNPTKQHFTAIKYLFRYLQGICDLVLVYKSNLKSLIGYTDADWGGDVATRRSTSGYIFNIAVELLVGHQSVYQRLLSLLAKLNT